jgi:hypothetical protein
VSPGCVQVPAVCCLESIPATLTLNNIAVNAAATLALSAPGLVFSPATVTVSAGGAESSSFTVHAALSSTPPGLVTLTVAVTLGSGSNNALPTSSLTVANALSVSLTQLTAVSVTPSVELLAGGACQSLAFALSTAAVNAPVTLTLTAPEHVTLSGNSVEVPAGLTASAAVSACASAAAPPGPLALSLAASGGSLLNMDLGAGSFSAQGLVVAQVGQRLVASAGPHPHTRTPPSYAHSPAAADPAWRKS